VPERWVVRTVDGRELEFKALRELQAAIASTAITREDVLSRGATRPRRLGSIAELDPFFASASPMFSPGQSTQHGVGPRPRVPTPQGLGAFAPRHEGSVAIPLPIAPRTDAEDAARPTLNARRPAAPTFEDESGALTIPRGSFPDLMEEETRVARPGAAGSAPPTLESRTRPVLDDLLATRESNGSSRGARLPPPPAPPPPTEPSPEIARMPSRPPPPAPPPPPPKRIKGNEKTVPVPVYDPDRPPNVSEIKDPNAPASEDEMRFTASYGTPRESRSSEARYSEVLHAGAVATPTPSAQQRNTYTNEDYVEPRFSSLAPPKRASGVRWIVGFFLSGVIVLFVVTLGRKMLVSSGASASTASEASSDDRVAKLLGEGEKALTDGDLDAAQEQLDKASALAEKDAKVAAAVARLAVTRGDVAWLRVKLLPDGDPDLAGAKKSLASDAERARKAVAHASELAPNDLAVTRAHIDALRIAGDVAGARKVVPQISSLGAQPETALALAALDLDEAKVDWPPVIGRLRTATAAEGRAGRARSMLVYALAKSGDGAAAKAELAELEASHPLTHALRAFLGKAGGTVDLSTLPEVGKEIPADWRDALKQADAAKGKGNRPRAEALYAGAIEESKGEPEALAGFADYKWETGDRPGAQKLYKQALAKAPASSALAKHAKERLEARAERREEGEPPPRHREPAPEREIEPSIPLPPSGNGNIDTSDLPGVKAPPAAPKAAPPPPAAAPADDLPKPAPKPAAPAGVDTSDLPGLK
jgi:hypothetical protein